MKKIRGITKSNFLSIMVISCGLLTFSLAYAAPQNSNTVNTKDLVSSAKAEAQKDNSTKTNKSIAQGLSIAESMMLNESPWGISFSANAERGLDEYADTWTSVNYLSLSYRLDSQSALGINLGYEDVIYKKGGKLFYNYDPDPGQYGFQDINVSYTRPSVWSNQQSRLVWVSNLNFPSSRLSQRASMKVEATTGLALRYQPTADLIITPSVSTYYRQFQYETTDIWGIRANSPIGFNAGLSLAYTFNPWFIGSASYRATERYDFFDDWRTIQSATATLTLNATNVLNVSAGYNWRDTLITNEPLFDDDRSIYFIGVGYVF